ncbi:proton-conducting transporter membrane subunit [Fervidobacterium thailandense]|uniref:Oxidoreductase n=1 Tax=Fervidobacterium thailandense TaxID=1008305 RepID=A0A1E3G313_9BACT|nr:proton-conducting transporter membrane subunit [Fervidobacterium thailandense]ODN30661.1 oxidoreductase [Fervidobacterium thailandense]
MQNVLLVAITGSAIGYFLSLFYRRLGPVILLFISLYAFITLWGVPSNTAESFLGYDVLYLTALGKYFALVSLIVFIAYAIFNIVWIETLKTPHAFNALSILTLAGTLGVFFTTNLLTLYIFWELTVFASLFIVPMSKPEAKRAAVWYVTITAVGSFAFLFATFFLYSKFSTFDLIQIAREFAQLPKSNVWLVVWLMLTAGIAKSGVFPLHVWLRNVHGKAPDTFSAVLSGQLVKMGSYLIALLLAIFPVSTLFSHFYGGVNILSYILIWLGNVSILVGTLMAIKQNDMKMLIAFSTVANSGYILIGLALLDQVGFAGGLFHVFNHAIAAAMIFLSFAAVVYRTGTTKIDELGGLIHRMPITFITYLVGIISLAGIPPTSGFISKWMIFQSLVSRGMFVTEIFVFVGSIGSFLYVFRPLAGVFLGQLKSKHKDVREVPIIMQIPMILLVLITVFFGIFPGQVLELITDVQKELGIDAFQYEGTKLITSMGYWDTWIVFVMFAVGFLIAAVLYLITPKGRKIPLEDQYTSGEFLHNFDLYHYASRFYAFLEREYEGHPSLEKLYASLVNVLKSLGKGIDYLVSRTASAYVFWLGVILLLLWKGW